MRFIDWVEDENGVVRQVQREITWEQVKRLMHEGRRCWRERQKRSNSEGDLVVSTAHTQSGDALSSDDIQRKAS